MSTQVPYDDEIDLFELFETLWDGKWLIGGLVCLALVIGGTFLVFTKAEYSSKLIYSTDTLPPFYGEGKALSDFRERFYDKETFEGWLSDNPNTSVRYEEFSGTEIVEGFVLARDEDDQLALFDSEKKKKKSYPFVLVRSNELPKLNDFYLYAQHINTLLSERYIRRSKDELVLIEKKFKEFPSVADAIINNLLAIDRYIAAASEGAHVLSIARPTMPEKTAPRSALILVMSVVLGGIVAVFYIFLRNAIRNRKKQLAEAEGAAGASLADVNVR